MTFQMGAYVGNDDGSSGGASKWTNTDSYETSLLGTLAPAGGFGAYQISDAYAYGAGETSWGGSVTTVLGRGNTWADAHSGRMIYMPIQMGFPGNTGNDPTTGFNNVISGARDTSIQQMVSAINTAGLIDQIVLLPYKEAYGYWYEHAWANLSGVNTASVPAGDRRGLYIAAFRHLVLTARAQEVALLGTSGHIKWGWSWAGDINYNYNGAPGITGGPNGLGAYPGDDVVDYINPDDYTDGSFAPNAAQVRQFAIAHSKLIHFGEVGIKPSPVTDAQNLAFLKALYAEVSQYNCYAGLTWFETVGDVDSRLLSGPNVAAMSQSHAYLLSAFGAPINAPGGGGSPAITNVVVSVSGTTATITGNASASILNVVASESGTKKAEATPVSGAFTITIPNLSVATHTIDLDGWNVPPGGSGSVIATDHGLSVVVTSSPTIATSSPSTSGTTRTIPFTTTGTTGLNVVATEGGVVCPGTNNVAPVSNAGTIVVTGLGNGSHTITLSLWNSAAGQPGSVVATVTDTFTIVTQPTPDDFGGITLAPMWTVKNLVGDGLVAVAAGGLHLTCPSVILDEPFTRADLASPDTGSPYGITLLQGTAELKSNAIHDTNTSGTTLLYRVNTPCGSNDQSTTVTLGPTFVFNSDTEFGAIVRLSNSPTSGFYLANMAKSGANWNVYILAFSAPGTFIGQIGATSANMTAPAVGDQLKLEARTKPDGTTDLIASYQIGAGAMTQVASGNDSNVPTGTYGGGSMKRANATDDVYLTETVVASGDHINYLTDRSVGVQQGVADGDYTVEMKWDSIPSLATQVQGVEFGHTGDSDRLVFGIQSNGSSTGPYAQSFVSNVATPYTCASFPTLGTSMWVRITRVGNLWTYQYSPDGVSYITVASFTYAMTVGTIHPFADNH